MPKQGSIDLEGVTGAQRSQMPTRFPPMLATLIKKPFTDPDWYFEPKLDGYRVIAFVSDGKADLQSRHFQNYTDLFPGIAKNLSMQRVNEAIFDGELISLDEKGKPCFQCLQQHLSVQKGAVRTDNAVIYYVFDVLFLNGYDLTSVAQSERAALLGKIFRPGKYVKLISRFEGNGAEIGRAHV